MAGFHNARKEKNAVSMGGLKSMTTNISLRSTHKKKIVVDHPTPNIIVHHFQPLFGRCLV